MSIAFFNDYLTYSYKVRNFEEIFKTMKINYSTLAIALIIVLNACNMKNENSTRAKAIRNIQEPKSLKEVQDYELGEWQSISVELRPTEDRTGSGKIQPTFLKRNFKYLSKDKFVGTITMFGDDYGNLPLLEFEFKGKLNWGKEHPIADGAWEIDYVLDEGFAVTPLNDQAAAMLNAGLPEGMTAFEANQKNDILGQSFPMFNIVKGQIVSDYDLIYFKNGLLFMGAKHVDGTPFDKVENRPHQLQIPLERI